MRFSAVAAAALSLAAGATAHFSNESYVESYVTEVVTAYTTFCPAPTVITHNNVTYTVTEVCIGRVPWIDAVKSGQWLI